MLYNIMCDAAVHKSFLLWAGEVWFLSLKEYKDAAIGSHSL